MREVYGTHGGAHFIRCGERIYTPEDIRYDFSVNIDPLGIPEGVREIFLREPERTVTRYPDRDCTHLAEAFAERTGIPEEAVLFGNGASELIQAVFFALHPENVLLCAPTFSGYRRAAKAAGASVHCHILQEEDGYGLTETYLRELEALNNNCGDGNLLAVLCRPSNPVGVLDGSGFIGEILDICEKRGVYLLMDECFIAFTEREEENTLRKKAACGTHPHLMVLDAFTKRYAMPGLRLGTLVTGDAALREKIALMQPEWSVSTIAQEAGVAALKTDREHHERTLRLIREERAYLKGVLGENGCKAYKSDANFILFRTEKGERLFPEMLERGILIRHCADYEGLTSSHYRIAVKTHEENMAFAAALSDIMKGEDKG